MIGMVVCLVIAIVYGIVVSVMLSRDSIARMKLKAKKKLETMAMEKARQDNEIEQLNTSGNPSIHMYPGYHEDSNYHEYNRRGEDQYEELKAGTMINGDHQVNVDVHTSGYGSGESSVSGGGHGNYYPGGRVNNGFSNDSELPKYETSMTGYKSQSTPRQMSEHPNPSAPPGGYTEQTNLSVPPEHYRGARPKQQPPPNTTNNNYYPPPPNNPQFGHKDNALQGSPLPYQQSPWNNSRSKAPGQYNSYGKNLETKSQSQDSDKNKPVKGIHSDPRRPAPQRTEDERKAYTDVRKEGPKARQHYTEPRKLDFVNGEAQRPYVNQTDTAI